jgi:hypothetical protein
MSTAKRSRAMRAFRTNTGAGRSPDRLRPMGIEIVHAVCAEHFRIGVSDAADVVGMFDARVRYQWPPKESASPSISDIVPAIAQAIQQQRQKENRWLHGVSIGLRVCKAPRMRVVFRKSSLGAERYATAALIVVGLGQAESKLMQL